MPNKSRIATLLKRTIPEKMPCKLLKTGRQTRKDDEKKKVLIKAKSERWKNETTNRKKTREEEEEEDQKHKRNALQTRNTTNKDWRIKHAPCQFRSLYGDFLLRASTWPLYVGKFLTKKRTKIPRKTKTLKINQPYIDWVMLFSSREGRPIIGSISQHGLQHWELEVQKQILTVIKKGTCSTTLSVATHF